MSSSVESIDYFMQTVERADGARDYRLFILDRPGRGLIENPVVDIVGRPGHHSYGFVMSYIAKDGKHEQIGTLEHPLPVEFLEQSQTDYGLTVVFMRLDETGKTWFSNGQVLYTNTDIRPLTIEPLHRARQSV